MSRLTSEEIHGIWAGITMSWDEDDRFDEESYRVNTEAMCRAGAHGIYTTGSTGEFYAVSDDEFRRMVDMQAEICGAHKMPLQIGCCSDSTAKTTRLLEYAAAKPEVGAAQIRRQESRKVERGLGQPGAAELGLLEHRAGQA